MKKHSGAVLYIGVMVAIFGILIMGVVNAASDLVLGSAYGSAGAQYLGIAQTVSDISLSLIIIGALFLGLGLFMRSGSD
jgi:hypothetical protein